MASRLKNLKKKNREKITKSNYFKRWKRNLKHNGYKHSWKDVYNVVMQYKGKAW